MKPSLFLAGAPKCGTSALGSLLAQHPHINMCKVKEPNFFCHDFDVPGCKTESSYLALFSPTAATRYLADGSILYLYSSTSALEIKKYSPDARIVIILRNPVDVMHSWHSQMVFTCNEDIADFGQALAAESERKKGNCIPKSGTGNRCPQLLFYREIVRFDLQLERFFTLFERSQIKVISFDDFKQDSAAVYRDLTRFLDLDDDFIPDYAIVNPSKRRRSWRLHYWAKRLFSRPSQMLPLRFRLDLINMLDRVNSKQEKRPAMDAQLRAQLTQEFQPTVMKLSGLLDRDLSHWFQPLSPASASD